MNRYRNWTHRVPNWVWNIVGGLLMIAYGAMLAEAVWP